MWTSIRRTWGNRDVLIRCGNIDSPPRRSRSRSPRPKARPSSGAKSQATAPATGGDAMEIDPKSSATAAEGESAAPKSKKKAKPVEEEDEETAMIRKMMGFAKFKTTKQTKVPGNNVYAVRKEKKAEYRQYMNRQGGFNRPLSPSR